MGASRPLSGYVMGERELADPQLQRLAKAIYVEICKQFDARGPAAPQVCSEGGMRNVMIEGHLDLMKVAAALTKRCCVLMPDIETIPDAPSIVRRKKSDREDPV